MYVSFLIVSVVGIILGIVVAPLAKEAAKKPLIGIGSGVVIGAVFIITSYVLEEAVETRSYLILTGVLTYAVSVSFTMYYRWKRENASPGKKP